MQDKMEMGVLESGQTPKQKVVRMSLGDSLAMLGLPHAHVIHEADPDTKVIFPDTLRWPDILLLQHWFVGQLVLHEIM